ncbi:MAG: universal stress protein [Firmicutes bacterium]|nr:universal stress protein [Bacillota bacterium]
MKAVIATDGSKSAQEAVRFAARLIPPFDSFVVVNIQMMARAYMEGVSPQEVVTSLQDAGQKMVDEAAALLEQHGAQVEKLVSVAPQQGLAQTIVEIARQRQADAIIMGSRGLSDLRGFFLGSVSHAVLSRSPVPVLIVPAASAES